MTKAKSILDTTKNELQSSVLKLSVYEEEYVKGLQMTTQIKLLYARPENEIVLRKKETVTNQK